MLDDYTCKINLKRIRCRCAWPLEWIGVNSIINSPLSYQLRSNMKLQDFPTRTNWKETSTRSYILKEAFPSCIRTYNDTVNRRVSANNMVMLNIKWKKSFFIPHATTTIEDVMFGPEVSLLSGYIVGFIPLTWIC